MKKLTAGIFAGILTIVTVNAADAAIASKAYVDQKDTANATAITNLTTTVEGHTTSITSLQTAVDNLSGDGTGSVADQIADALGNIPEGSTVQAELAKKADKTALEDVTKDGGTIDTKISAAQTTLNTEIAKKQDKSTADYAMGTAAGGWKALTDAEKGVLQSGITSGDVAQITTNKNDISGINTKIGTLPEGETDVVTMIQKVETAAGSDLTDKLGEDFPADSTVKAELDKKQNLLDGTNVTTTGTGNAIVDITAADGVVTATKGAVIPAVTKTGETGTYVLTATVTESGVTNYMWESIKRATAQTTEP